MTEIAEAAELAPQEARLVGDAKQGRRAEFAAGRLCARTALRAVGCDAAAIGRGHLGEPLWPAGFGGSITHGRVFAAAIAYRLPEHDLAWGIDLVDQPDRSVFQRARHLILSDAEARGLDLAGAERSEDMIGRVFSAKEAASKILSPRLRRHVHFRELEVTGSESELLIGGPHGEPILSRSEWVDDVLVTVARLEPGPAHRQGPPGL